MGVHPAIGFHSGACKCRAKALRSIPRGGKAPEPKSPLFIVSASRDRLAYSAFESTARLAAVECGSRSGFSTHELHTPGESVIILTRRAGEGPRRFSSFVSALAFP